jgi:hypothetical protein
MSIGAPQYALPDEQEDPTAAPQPALRRLPVPNPALQPPRPLTATDRRLARYLRRTLGFQFGAEHFVRKHGTQAILAAIHDGIMVWQEHQVGRPGPNGTRIIETVESRIPNPHLKSPAAYLNKMLNNP